MKNKDKGPKNTATRLEPGSFHNPDRQAVAAAAAAQQQMDQQGLRATLILFGSRARGEHRPNSDMDVLVVDPDSPPAAEHAARKLLKEHFGKHPPELDIQTLSMRSADFHHCRRSINHVAGQAYRQGVIMSTENLNYGREQADHDDGYPNCWPDVKQRLQNARRRLRTMSRLAQYGEEEQLSSGFCAQQAMENAIKGWCSASNIEYREIHNLETLSDLVLNDTQEKETDAATDLKSLMEQTRRQSGDRPNTTMNWLTHYAVTHRCQGTSYTMSEDEAHAFLGAVQRVAGTMMERTHHLTGTSPEDLETR